MELQGRFTRGRGRRTCYWVQDDDRWEELGLDWEAYLQATEREGRTGQVKHVVLCSSPPGASVRVTRVFKSYPVTNTSASGYTEVVRAAAFVNDHKKDRSDVI